MPKSNHQEDLDLLLSLEDRVPETPPASPSGYLSDDGREKGTGNVDMSVFRDVVGDCLNYDAKNAEKLRKPEQGKSSSDIEIDKFSGLRIKSPLLSRVELSNHFSDIRFIQLPTIKNLLLGDTLSGCWATTGVLTEIGNPKTSSIGQTYTRWRIGCLDEHFVTLLLFGDAYKKTCEEKIGGIFALFNCSVRKDNIGNGFTLNVYAGKHILKLGTSADFGVCQGKGKDGATCTKVINKRQTKLCDYHKNASARYTSTRAELKGGNLSIGFKNHLKSEGIYVVKPAADKHTLSKSTRPVKLLSVEGLKKALSKADKVTTNACSQGIRFLNHIAGKLDPQVTNKETNLPKKSMGRTDSRSRLSQELPVAKKMKTGQKNATQDKKENSTKMIELELVSSDDGF